VLCQLLHTAECQQAFLQQEGGLLSVASWADAQPALALKAIGCVCMAGEPGCLAVAQVCVDFFAECCK